MDEEEGGDMRERSETMNLQGLTLKIIKEDYRQERRVFNHISRREHQQLPMMRERRD